MREPHIQKSMRRHRWQVFWQIILPLIAGSALLAFGLVALMGAQDGNVTRMSQITTILMMLPLLLVGLVFLALVIALVVLLGRLMNWLPPQTFKVQRGAHAISSRVVSATDAVIKPVIAIESWVGAANDVIRRK